MSIPILSEEDYEYTYNKASNNLKFHFDYGRRFHEINMKFLHFHPFYEIYVLLQGQAEHIVEGEIYEIEEFDMVFLKPYHLHKTNYHKNRSCCRLIISFEISFFEKNFPNVAMEINKIFTLNEPVFRFCDSIKEDFVQRFNAMFLASKETNSTTDFLLATLFMQFLAHLVQIKSKSIFIQNRSTRLDDSTDTVNRKINDIVSFIHQNYAGNLSLNMLSDKFFISPHYLSRKFKEITKFNLVDYIQQTRVKRAQELLLNTELKIIDITELCGFGSLSQFNRVFHNIVMIPPRDFRKQNKILIQDKYH